MRARRRPDLRIIPLEPARRQTLLEPPRGQQLALAVALGAIALAGVIYYVATRVVLP